MIPFNIIRLCNVALLDLIKTEHSVYNASTHLSKAMDWLCLAHESTVDGGVSEGYHLYHEWLPSYPETTGYLIETFFDYAHFAGDESLGHRAVRMADWLISIQNDDGSIPDSSFKEKVVFDTGQVVFGFIRCYEETGEQKYLDSALRAGNWLLDVQENDGTWRKYAINQIPHTYYTRVAWSLLLLHHVTDDQKYVDSCIRNVEWALTQQKDNGWFQNSSFSLEAHKKPYTHTIAYTLRGILESGLYLDNKRFIDSVINAMRNLMKQIPDSEYIAGSYDKEWNGDNTYSCLTGNAQLAIIMLKLYDETDNIEYLEFAKKTNRFLKRKQELRLKNKTIHGAMQGSFPIWGRYIHYAYPNWAAKFFVDALLLEEKIINRK
jgi:uncharacterized protein YyaL (SSP411 family)